MAQQKVLVAGGGGFIGGHLARRLLDEGFEVRCCDVKTDDHWYQRHDEADNQVLDLALLDDCRRATEGVDIVYNLAADMGGMGFIENNKALCMLSVLINTHLLQTALAAGVTALLLLLVGLCLRRRQADVTRRHCASGGGRIPGDARGWLRVGKVVQRAHVPSLLGGLRARDSRRPLSQRLRARRHLRRRAREGAGGDLSQGYGGQALRTSRHRNLGRRRADSQLLLHRRLRRGTRRILDSEIDYPINLGSEELVTINQLVDIAEEIAGIKLERHYDLSAPQGVRGRNSDNERLRAELGWEPSIALKDGLSRTYSWIEAQLATR